MTGVKKSFSQTKSVSAEVPKLNLAAIADLVTAAQEYGMDPDTAEFRIFNRKSGGTKIEFLEQTGDPAPTADPYVPFNSGHPGHGPNCRCSTQRRTPSGGGMPSIRTNPNPMSDGGGPFRGIG